MYRSSVDMRPMPALAGQSTTLTFTVRDGSGRIVSELPIAHEQPMHVIIISRDLEHFAHLHPALDGSALRVEHTFDAGGEYLVVVDYQEPGGGQVVDIHRIHIAGAPRTMPNVLTESEGMERADGLELTLRTDTELVAGQSVMLHFDVKDAASGQPVTDLEPYLGSTAHFMILSGDGQDFVHAHAVDSHNASRVSAHAAFPRAGLHKLWVQVQRGGAVVTVPFVLRVGGAVTSREAGSVGGAHGSNTPGGHVHQNHGQHVH